jgi:hypothetical protein
MEVTVKPLIVRFLFVMTAIMLQPIQSFSQDLPYYLRDRGTGIPTSILGTYVRKGEFLIYPFYEYYYDSDREYEPADFGFGPPQEQEFRGRYHANEALLFLSYGISENWAVEFEAGVIDAKLNKASNDFSALPTEITESGLSDVEAQVRWRWNHESAKKPEFFSYFETTFPTGKTNSLIGTSDWELTLGGGLIKGFRWGTVTVRASVEYDAAENKAGFGEYAFEYLKKLSGRFRFYTMLEGSEDEISLVPGMEWYLGHGVSLKVNNGFGLTSKATDLAPEIGIMFSLTREHD